MKISVIAIFYKAEAYAAKCINSILMQSGDFDLEIIAVDDCSPDNTCAILKSFNDNRIKVIRHPVNQGISAARNTGLSNITGDCFYFIDGDDYLPKGALSRLYAHYDFDVDWVQGAYLICDEDGKVLSVKRNPAASYDSHSEICSNFDKIEFIYTHNRLVNKRWKTVKYPVGKAHEDRFWNVTVFPRLSKIVNIEDPTYNYVTRQGSFSNKSRSSRMYIDSAVEVMQLMAKLESCWKIQADTFLITAIEKNLYLWNFSGDYRKEVCVNIRSLPAVTIDISRFPRFTKMIHKLIVAGCPDFLINLISLIYRYVSMIIHRPI